jgi:hypothetical protein
MGPGAASLLEIRIGDGELLNGAARNDGGLGRRVTRNV